MKKNAKFDLRSQYKRTLQISAIAALLLVIAAFIAFKKFEADAEVCVVEIPPLEIQDIPRTKMERKVEVPPKPIVPVEAPEVDEAVDVSLPGDNIVDYKFQPPPASPPLEQEERIYVKVERMPELIGGLKALSEYIQKNRLYPRFAAENRISGKVMIEFVVDKEGNPTQVTVLEEKPPNLGFGEAGVQAVSAMRFTPGHQQDRIVVVRMKQPIFLKID
ncbi:MAG: TonB family protein [Calditrichota bacterium]